MHVVYEQVYSELQRWGCNFAGGHADGPNLGLWVYSDVAPLWNGT